MSVLALLGARVQYMHTLAIHSTVPRPQPVRTERDELYLMGFEDTALP